MEFLNPPKTPTVPRPKRMSLKRQSANQKIASIQDKLQKKREGMGRPVQNKNSQNGERVLKAQEEIRKKRRLDRVP